MKRIALIILAVAAIISSSVSCNKNDITPESSMPLVSMSIIPDFTVVGEVTSGSVEEGYMTAYFE